MPSTEQIRVNEEVERRLSEPGPERLGAGRVSRLYVGALARLAPDAAIAYAARGFLTPPRRARRRRGTHPDVAAMMRGDEATDATMLRVRSARTNVAAVVSGRGLRTVLLVHGWGGAGDDMQVIGDALTHLGYRVVTVDFPAHGNSTGAQTTLPEMIQALVRVASVVGPIDTIVAHSLGAAAAVIGMGDGSLSARGVVLLAPAIGPLGFIERYCRGIGLPKTLNERFVRRIGSRAGRDVATLDARVGARRIDVPAVIIHDPSDREVPFEQALQIAHAWRGNRALVPAAAVGHRRILRDPLVLAEIRQFVASLEPAVAAD